MQSGGGAKPPGHSKDVVTGDGGENHLSGVLEMRVVLQVTQKGVDNHPAQLTAYSERS